MVPVPKDPVGSGTLSRALPLKKEGRYSTGTVRYRYVVGKLTTISGHIQSDGIATQLSWKTRQKMIESYQCGGSGMFIPDPSSLGRYVFGSEISYNKAPPRLPGLGC